MDVKEAGTDSKYILMQCDDEVIVIETNYFSDESESSEVSEGSVISECMSDSDYVEIEVDHSQKRTPKLKDSFVRLVRCDYLLSKEGTYTTNEHKNSELRFSNRRKVPNRTYQSDEYYLHNLPNRKDIHSTKQTKKQSQRKRMHKYVPEKQVLKDRTLKFKERTLTFKKECTYTERVNTNTGSNLAGQSTSEQTACLPENIRIKSEPYDAYMHIDTNQCPKHVPDYTTSVRPVIKQEPPDEYIETPSYNRILHTEQEHGFSGLCRNKGFGISGLGRYSLPITKMEVSEKTNTSIFGDVTRSESDVDIEDEWDCSEFIKVRRRNEIEHNYHLPYVEPETPSEVQFQEVYKKGRTREKKKLESRNKRNKSPIELHSELVQSRKRVQSKSLRSRKMLKASVITNPVNESKTNEYEYGDADFVLYVISRFTKNEHEYLLVQNPKKADWLRGKWVLPFEKVEKGKVTSDIENFTFRGLCMTDDDSEVNTCQLVWKVDTNDQKIIVRRIVICDRLQYTNSDNEFCWVKKATLLELLKTPFMKEIFVSHGHRWNIMQHNALEKIRRSSMANRFHALRDVLPVLAGCCKVSKVMILQSAANFIKDLRVLDEENELLIKALKGRRNMLEKHVKKLQNTTVH